MKMKKKIQINKAEDISLDHLAYAKTIPDALKSAIYYRNINSVNVFFLFPFRASKLVEGECRPSPNN